MLVQSPLLRAIPSVRHGFSGAIDLAGQSSTIDGPPAWGRLCQAVGVEGVAWPSQVHGIRVVCARTHGPAGEADAVWTETPGLAVAVRVADCVPVLLVADGRVAAAHAGWRGLAAGVLQETLDAMGGASHAVIGPCIGARSYEVGEEVVESIARTVPEDVFVDRSQARPHVDLAAAARHQLRTAGVTHIDVLGIDTFSDARFHSHRRDAARAGRQAGIVAWVP